MIEIIAKHCSHGTVSGDDQLFAALAVRIRPSGRGNRDAQTVILVSPDAGITWRVVPYQPVAKVGFLQPIGLWRFTNIKKRLPMQDVFNFLLQAIPDL